MLLDPRIEPESLTGPLSEYDETNKMACAPCEDSDEPVHPGNQIRVLAVRMKKRGYP